MSTREDATRFVDTLKTDHQGVLILSHLFVARDKNLIPADAIASYLKLAADHWLEEIATGLPPTSGRLALLCARRAAGSGHGFPGPDRKIEPQKASPQHYVVVDFATFRRYHFDLDGLLAGTTLELESCGPAEYMLGVKELLDGVKALAKHGKAPVKAGAWMGSPLGAVWSTSDHIDALGRPSIPVANTFRNRLGLVDSHWASGSGLVRYSISSGDLGALYRPTPIEGGNSRFRLEPCAPHNFHPLGATVDLEQLNQVIKDGSGNDDGVGECVSEPFQPTTALWFDFIRDMRFVGAMSHEEDLPQCTDEQFRKRVLENRDVEWRINVIKAIL